MARSILPDFRVANCLRVPNGGLVEVLHHAEHSSASFGGLQTCASVHVCPCCGAKVSARRAEELLAGARAWLDAGGAILFVTFTLQHERGDSLAEVGGALNEAYRWLRRGGPWARLVADTGLVGTVTAREYTHGVSGWHPHLHALFFVRKGALGALRDRLAVLWPRALARLGRWASAQHGVMVKACNDEDGLTMYTTKAGAWTVADELTKAGNKAGRRSGRSMSQILEAARHDDASAALYREYAGFTFRRNALVWSPGLRSRLLGTEDEPTDEELAGARSADGRLLVVLDREQWRVVVLLDARAELLLSAAAGDVGQVADFLDGLGVVLDLAGLAELAGRVRAVAAA